MLLQKQNTVPYIGIFKIASGEEFIGKVVNETATSYTISKPLCMVGTEKGFQFAPFIMMGDMDADVELPKPVIQTKPNTQILNQYETATSPIAMPVRSSIIV
jgi:hypothetical protein